MRVLHLIPTGARACVHVALALLEALFKCTPVYVIQLVAIYPLTAVGQGREAMRALLDPGPNELPLLLFPISLAYSCLLTAFFLFFLLDRWNYAAGDGVRGFCRIWVPSTLALIVGLMWPVSAELVTHDSTFFDALIGILNWACVDSFVYFAWQHTKPSRPERAVLVFSLCAIVPCGFFIVGSLLLSYASCFVALTAFCIYTREDFRDGDLGFSPTNWCGLLFAVLLAGIALALSATAVPWRMALGAPSAIMWGFSFLISVAFLLTALLRLASAMLTRLGWLLLAAILLVTPLNHEPLRVLPNEPAAPQRLPPSAHFVEWLRARPQILTDGRPYPIFFVAAKGGGIRAAYWTATLLAGLEERYPGFTEHVYAVSGVSGGSVGAAAYAAMYRDLPARGDRACAPWNSSDVRGLRPCTASLFGWDLLGPSLSGLLLNDVPFGWSGVRRARSLEEGLEYAWLGTMETGRFGEPFQELWRDRPYGVPSLILNSTSADDGRRVVVSNLVAEGQLTALPDVEALAGHPVRLSTAVFLSARFPLISPLATFKTPGGRQYRLADGGYFDNSGLASTASLLRAVLPAVSSGEFAGRVRPIVLVVSNSPIATYAPGTLSGSLAGAVYGPVSVLQSAGEAHEDTYTNEVTELVGREWVSDDLRPPTGSPAVALGWLLSADTRCGMDRTVNDVLNGSKGSAAVRLALGTGENRPTTWTSCSSQHAP